MTPALQKYIMSVGNIIKHITNIGVSKLHPSEINNQTQLLNSACLVCISSLTLNAILSYIQGVLISSVFAGLYIAVLIAVLLLNQLHHIWKARILIIIWYGVHVILHAIFFGQFHQLVGLYIVVFIFCIVLFEDKFQYTIALGLYLVSTYFVSKQLVNSAALQDNLTIAETMTDVNFVLSIVLTSLMLRTVLKSKNAYLNRTQLLLEDIEEKNIELKNKNQKIETSNIELERFAYIASHDLKEPLRNIFGFSTLLERRLKNIENIPHIDEYINFIKKSANQMYNLIQEVLEYSKVDDKRKYELKKTNLNELIDQVRETTLTYLKENNATINISTSSSDFYTNTSQLFLVFKNLITNGIKYNNNAHKVIDISYQDKGKFHQFCIKDNGIGIPLEYQDKIFEMFKRLHNRQEYQGTGLGLAICKKVITNMEGKIWCESSEAGSTFYFTIAKKQEYITTELNGKEVTLSAI